MPIGSPINDFRGFAIANDANVQPQPDYLSSDERQKGMQAGPADSAKCNKIWRQGANMAAAMGAVMNARGFDAVDDGDVNELYHNLFSALAVIPCYNAATFDYLEGAIVQQNPGWALWQGPLELYVCIQRTGPSYGGTAPLTDTTHWQPIAIGGGGAPASVSAYDATYDYSAGDLCSYSGDTFLALQANGPGSTVAAPTNNAYWQKVLTSVATSSAAGLMSATDKSKLDGITTMTGAAAGTTGASGLVPAPAAGDQAKVLQGDGTWGTPIGAVMTGATSSTAGTAGSVPAPAAGDDGKFLRGDGNWAVVSGGGTAIVGAYDATHDYAAGALCSYSGDVFVALQANGPGSTVAAPTNAAYWAKVLTSTATASAAGLMSATDKAKLDGVGVMTGAGASTAGAAGLVPAPAAGDNGSFLRGDGQWINPAGILPPPNIPMYYTTDDYVLNDIVTSSGMIYLALQDSGPNTPNGVHTLNESAYWAPFAPGDPIVDITISGSTMTLVHASGSTVTRTLPTYDNADTTNY